MSQVTEQPRITRIASLRGRRFARECEGDVSRAIVALNVAVKLGAYDGMYAPHPASAIVPKGGDGERPVLLVNSLLSPDTKYLEMLRAVAHLALDHRYFCISQAEGPREHNTWRSTCPQIAQDDAFVDGWLGWCLDRVPTFPDDDEAGAA